jgi:hypothetical protein
MQPCTPIIPYSDMKLLKTLNILTTPLIFLMQFLKINSTAHGYVDMVHNYLYIEMSTTNYGLVFPTCQSNLIYFSILPIFSTT